jgi:hypothetical protein
VPAAAFEITEGGGLMTQLARRASLVVVLLLTSVATASAECARVLWLQGPQTLSATGAWQTRKESEAEHRRREAAVAEYRRELQRRGEPLSGGAGVLLCLPDTIEPRAPKGK